MNKEEIIGYCKVCQKHIKHRQHIHWDGAKEWVCENGHCVYSEITKFGETPKIKDIFKKPNNKIK